VNPHRLAGDHRWRFMVDQAALRGAARRSVVERDARLAPGSLAGALAPENLLTDAFPADDLRLFAPQHARCTCKCSSDSAVNLLRLLGGNQIEGNVGASVGAGGPA
jgi:redox-regulated HSP33 family molecular chaperone